MIPLASSQERLQLAREIHDGIAQDLVALGYEIDLVIADSYDHGNPTKEIRALRFSVDELIGKVRREMYTLRDQSQKSLQEELLEIATEICGDSLINTQISDFFIPPETAYIIKSIATELLRNSVKHARASEIELTLTNLENRTYLEVRDNGVGGANMESVRLGLKGIKEQIDFLNGALHINSLESGTRIAITL